MENLGFAATPREFLKKIPGKTAETHEQDRQRMLSELPEKNSSPSKNPLWEEERTQELDHSRRVLSQKLKELATRQNPEAIIGIPLNQGVTVKNGKQLP